MENHAGTEVETMFEVSVLESRTPLDEVAFFDTILKVLVDVILFSVLRPEVQPDFLNNLLLLN
jgi:hypothetical protein